MGYFIAFLIMFISGGLIVILNWSDPFYPLILLSCLLPVFFRKKIYLSTVHTLINQSVYFLLFLALIFLRGETILYQDNLPILIKMMIMFFVGMYVFTYHETKRDFFKVYIKTFEFLIVLSWCSWIGANVLPFLIIPIKDGFSTFMGIGFVRYEDYHKFGFYRNQGVFWEPGMMGCMTVIAFIIKRYVLQQKERLWMYYVHIFTTVSIGAIGIFGLTVISTKYIDYVERSKLIGLIVTPLLLLGVGVVSYFSIFAPDTGVAILSTIFQRDLANDSSVFTRFADMKYGFQSAMDKKYIGHGRDFSDFYALTIQEINATKEHYDGGITNAIVSMFYMYGLFFIVFYLLLLFGALKSFDSKRVIPFVIAFIGILMFEPLQLSLLFMFLLTIRDGKRILLVDRS